MDIKLISSFAYRLWLLEMSVWRERDQKVREER
jgi:hypothetical protein